MEPILGIVAMYTLSKELSCVSSTCNSQYLEITKHGIENIPWDTICAGSYLVVNYSCEEYVKIDAGNREVLSELYEEGRWLADDYIAISLRTDELEVIRMGCGTYNFVVSEHPFIEDNVGRLECPGARELLAITKLTNRDWRAEIGVMC